MPSRPGRELNVAATTSALLQAASRPTERTATVVVAEFDPRMTTAEAKALRVERQLASYSTLYAGTADRINNLQLAIEILDGARIAPGATWSFNEFVGPRTAERGFRSAPVIMDGKYEEGIGGGVSQVATTVFNAAWEAGIKIGERHAHALYISRYPDGRDATVNYPDVDLKLVNDTPRWIVIKASYDESGILVRLLGAGPERRVESVAGELKVTGQPKTEREPDPTLYVGDRVVEFAGSTLAGDPSRADRLPGRQGPLPRVLVHALSYEAKIVRVGTKPRPEPAAPAAGRREEAQGGRPADDDRSRRRALAGLHPGDRLGEPGRHARRPQGLRVHAGVRRPPVGDDPRRLVHPLDGVLEAEARAAHVGRADMDTKLVVELRAVQVAHVGLGRRRVDSLLDEPLVARQETARGTRCARSRTRRGRRRCGRRPGRRSR